MPRSEHSIAIPTGMIIAALYTILLVGFSRESYMRRDATTHAVTSPWPTFRQISDQACRNRQLDCGSLFAEVGDLQRCPVSIEALGRLTGGLVPPKTAGDLQQALGAGP
jgi:hypothetical protein